jgi:hypothetical protein
VNAVDWICLCVLVGIIAACLGFVFGKRGALQSVITDATEDEAAAATSDEEAKQKNAATAQAAIDAVPASPANGLSKTIWGPDEK